MFFPPLSFYGKCLTFLQKVINYFLHFGPILQPLACLVQLIFGPPFICNVQLFLYISYYTDISVKVNRENEILYRNICLIFRVHLSVLLCTMYIDQYQGKHGILRRFA